MSLARAVGANWVSSAVGLAVTYSTLPLVLRHLGEEQYGSFLLVNSTLGYLTLLKLGLPMASTRAYTERMATGEQDGLDRTASSVGAIFLALSLLALVLSAGLFAGFAHLYAESAARVPGVGTAFAIQALGIGLGFLAHTPVGILYAAQRFERLNLVYSGALVLRLVLLVVLLPHRPSLITVAGVQFAASVVENIAILALVRRTVPALRVSWGRVSFAELRGILSFSVYILLVNAGGQLAFQTPPLVIGRVLGVDVVPFFAVPFNLVQQLMQLADGIAGVVVTQAIRLHARQAWQQYRALVGEWLGYVVTFGLTAVTFLVLAGADFLTWWLGADFGRRSTDPLIIVAIALLTFLPARAVALPVLMNTGQPRLPAALLLVAGLVSIALTALLARPLGLVGVAVGVAVPTGLVGLAVIVLMLRHTGSGVVEWLRVQFAPQLLLGAAITAGLMPFRGRRDLGGLPAFIQDGLLAALAYAMVFGATVYRPHCRAALQYVRRRYS